MKRYPSYTKDIKVWSRVKSVLINQYGGFSQQINEMVLKCSTCQQESQNHKETLLPSALPTMAKSGDRYFCPRREYLPIYGKLLLQGCWGRTPDSYQVHRYHSSFKVNCCLPWFSWGPDVIQWTIVSGQAFTSFAMSYGFRHETSSPQLPTVEQRQLTHVWLFSLIEQHLLRMGTVQLSC